MSDPTETGMGLVEHVGLAGGPALVLGFIQRHLHSASQSKLETTLAVLVAKVDQIAVTQSKHDSLGERTALNEKLAEASHKRLDDFETRFERVVNELREQLREQRDEPRRKGR